MTATVAHLDDHRPTVEMAAIDSPTVGGRRACRRGLITRGDFYAAADDALLPWAAFAVVSVLVALVVLVPVLGDYLFLLSIGALC